MYGYMLRNMLLINIIFKDTVIILTIKHFPVNRHKLINNQYPAMVKLLGTNSVNRAVKQPVEWQRASEADITLGLAKDQREYVARPGCQGPLHLHPLHLHDASLRPDLL